MCGGDLLSFPFARYATEGDRHAKRQLLDGCDLPLRQFCLVQDIGVLYAEEAIVATIKIRDSVLINFFSNGSDFYARL